VRRIWLSLGALFVLMAFSASAAQAATMLTESPTPVGTGATVTAGWSGVSSPTTADWIGVYAQGAANTAYSNWVYDDNCTKVAGTTTLVSGSCSINMPTTPGTYELRLLANNGFTVLATSAPVTVSSTTSLLGSPTGVAGGGLVTASWNNVGNPSSTDWVGVYAQGAANSAYQKWVYDDSCTQTAGTTTLASGSCSIAMPTTAGTYELRLFAADGYTLLATSGPITVSATTLSASPGSVGTGGSVTGSWSNVGNPSSTDWIGVYTPGSGSGSYLNWVYDNSCTRAAGATALASGSCSVTLPNTAGTYELRLYAADGWTLLATSGQVTVTGGTAPSNTGAPVITGTDRQGSTLSTTDGNWNGTTPMSFAYQWQRCDAGGSNCTNVGSNSSTYLLGPNDVDSTFRVTVTATNGAGSAASPPSALTPVVGLASDPVVVVVGDISCPAGDTTHSCKQAATQGIAQKQNPNAVFVLGDNQYNNGSLSEYNSTGAYNATWGLFNSIVHPVPGNHEYGTSGATGYFSYFGQAIANPETTPNGYYSFSLGTWHVEALNSNCTDSGCSDPLPGSTTSAQTSWLQSDLAANRSACVLGMWHHPLFSNGWTLGSPGVAPLWNALYNAHAAIILGGHDHLYERYAPQDASGNVTANGIREFVVGTGGESLNGLGSSNSNLQASDSSDFGVLVLTLHPTSYDYKFMNTGGTVKDSGTGVPCHGPGPSGAASVAAARHKAAAIRRVAAPTGPPLVFEARPLPDSLSVIRQRGLRVAIHADRGVDATVTVSLRRAGRLRRIASFYETESEIPKPFTQILLRLPGRRLGGNGPVTLVLRFAVVDSAFHRAVVTRTVRLTRP
jgi:acid phosphatase type 7